jgi:hypothetical protein
MDFNEQLKFPKTVSLNVLFENSDAETKLYTHDAKFLTTGKLIIDSFNIQESDILKGFVIKVSNPTIQTISILINDAVIEIAKPIILEDGKTSMFTFQIFNQNGVVQCPKLFDINFICEPIPSQEVPAILQYHGIVIEEIEDFLEYNQYYSIYQLNMKTLPDEKANNKVLTIYYSPTQNPPYNVRFLDLADIDEFIKAIELSYFWKTPIIYKFQESAKKEPHRLITVEISKEYDSKLESDPLLRYETRTVEIPNTKLISKSFLVHKSDRSDIEGHLLAEYGLVPYTTIVKMPRTEIDYDRMKQIFDTQMNVLKKIYGI